MQNKGFFAFIRNYIAVVLLCALLVSIVLIFQTSGHFRIGHTIGHTKQDAKRVPRRQLARSRPPDWEKGSSSIDVEPTGFVVDTLSCRIPDFDAFNPSISPYVRDPDPRFTVCNHSQPVTFTDRQYIRINTTLADSLGVQHCVYQQV